ncbi:hypothetical protein V6N13_043261 [Hibiscus sabdariffa]
MNNQETLAEYREKNDTSMQNLATSLRNLEIQMGQIANALNNRPQGSFPRDTKDPRQTRNEQFKALTLRNDSGDCQVDDKLESILRMDLVQLCQEMYYASNVSIDEHLEETIKDEKQSKPLEICDKRLKVLKPSIEEPPELELKSLPEYLKYADAL